MSNRLDNTRKVTFQEDYVTRSGKLLHAKGAVKYIHFKTVEKLKEVGAKMKVEPFDEKGETAKAREVFLEQEEKTSKKK